MLAEARAAGGPAEYRRGEAGATGLDDASVALVTVAQAFHWFEADAALAEFHRVLRPGGHVAAIWNLRAASPFMAEYQALLRRFSTEYSVMESWEESLARLRAHPRVEAPRDFEVPNAQAFDFEGLRGRVLVELVRLPRGDGPRGLRRGPAIPLRRPRPRRRRSSSPTARWGWCSGWRAGSRASRNDSSIQAQNAWSEGRPGRARMASARRLASSVRPASARAYARR